MAPSSSARKLQKPVHPHPAHKCAYNPCCNYVVPPAKGRKHRFCSEECLAALLVESHDYIPCRTCQTSFNGSGSRAHCPSCLALSRHSGQLPPHRCGYRRCCNFIVPPTLAKKYLFCSEECRAAQRRYGFNYSTCSTVGCGAEIKRDSYVNNCPECLAKKEQRQALARASERYPKKKCRWAFCQKEFQPGAATESYCSMECRKAGSRGHSGPGYPQKMPPAGHVFCEGNCGATFREGSTSPWGAPITHCRPCWYGEQVSAVRPFGPPLQPGWRRCQWVFCHVLYKADHDQQYGCCTLHEQLHQLGHQPVNSKQTWDEAHARYMAPKRPCANKCGTMVEDPQQDVCLPCWLGLRHGRVNPFSADEHERAIWGEHVVHLTEKQMAEAWDEPVPAQHTATEQSTAIPKPEVDKEVPKKKVTGRVCLYCAGRFSVSRLHRAQRYNRVCWPCWNEQLTLVIQQLRAEATERILTFQQGQREAQKRNNSAWQSLEKDAVVWLARVAEEAAHPLLPATITYHGAQKWQQLLQALTQIQTRLADTHLVEWSEWQKRIDHEQQALEGPGISWRAWEQVKERSRERRAELGREGKRPISTPEMAVDEDAEDGFGGQDYEWL